MGLREATFLKVDVYVAGLYLEKESTDAGEIIRSDQAERLLMKFVRAVGRKDLVKAWNEGFEKTASGSVTALKDRIATFNSWMDDLPNAGVTVEVQGATKGVIAGPDFAQALFGIWLGPSPPNPGLKEGLLGEH